MILPFWRRGFVSFAFLCGATEFGVYDVIMFMMLLSVGESFLSFAFLSVAEVLLYFDSCFKFTFIFCISYN